MFARVVRFTEQEGTMRFVMAALLLLGVNAHAKKSMKGWDLYTWEDPACGPQLESAIKPKLCYALVTGTNRLKSREELMKARVSFDDLKKKLSELPKGETIAWNNASSVDKVALVMPGEPRRQQILDEATRLGLKVER
jgi:hypothetical protein